MRRTHLLAAAVGLLAACTDDPPAATTGPTRHDAGPAPEAGTSFGKQCQYMDFAATSKEGLRIAGQLYLAESTMTPGDVGGVILGPPVDVGIQQRLSVTGSLMGGDVTLDVVLLDTTTLSLAGTSDALVAACRGEMRGTVTATGPDGGAPKTDAGAPRDAGAPDAGAVPGTWHARAAGPPPADAIECVKHAADPLVCGVFVP